MICVLLLASGAAWESTAMRALDQERGVVVLKRCVDVEDLLASATSGQAQVAVLALDAPGLDPAAVVHLRRHGVRPVAVADRGPREETADRATRLGVPTVLGAGEVADLPAVVRTVEDVADTRPSGPAPGPAPDPAPGTQETAPPEHTGRVVAVWGPAGAPGRTTVAVNLAAELAHRGRGTLLVDADPWGGTVAQHLGVLDEVSGLLSAARLAGAGQLEGRFDSVCRAITNDLAVVTGLPRADRWREVRPAHLEQVVATAPGHVDVVLDTGFSLEDESGGDLGSVSRNGLTAAALELADEVVLVGSAEPTGLARLARSLVDLRERSLAAPVRVVVNRMRPSLGWSEREVAGLVDGFAAVAGLHFLPEDRSAVDAAVVAGRPVVGHGTGPFARAVAELVDAVVPGSVVAAPPRRGLVAGLRQRTGGRARRR